MAVLNPRGLEAPWHTVLTYTGGENAKSGTRSSIKVDEPRFSSLTHTGGENAEFLPLHTTLREIAKTTPFARKKWCRERHVGTLCCEYAARSGYI